MTNRSFKIPISNMFYGIPIPISYNLTSKIVFYREPTGKSSLETVWIGAVN